MARKLFQATILSGLLLFKASVPAALEPDPIANLLDRDAGLILLIPDPPQLIDDLKAHPVIEAWNAEAVSWAFGATREWLAIDRWEDIARTQMGYPLDEVRAAFAGPAALVLWNEEGSAPWDLGRFGIVAEIEDGAEPAEALLSYLLVSPPWAKGSGAPYGTAKEDYLGTTLHYRKPTGDEGESAGELGWARIGDQVAVARPLKQLKRIVQVLVEGGESPSASASASLQQLRQGYPGADAYLHIDGPRLREYILKGVVVDIGDLVGSEEDAEEDRFSKDLVDSMRLDIFQALTMAVRLDTRLTDVDFDLTFAEEAGVLKLLAYDSGPLRLPSFLPDNLTDFDVTRLSLRDTWRAWKELSTKSESLTQLTSLLTTQLESASQSAGVDLERILLDGVGSQFFYGTFPIEPEEADAEPTPGAFFGIELKDEQSITLALDAMKESLGYAGLLDTHDYMETRIQASRSTGADGGRFAYAVTDGHLLFSTDLSTLQEAISRLRRPSRHESIWEKPEIKTALAELPEGASALGFSDPVVLLQDSFKSMHGIQRRRENRKGGVCKPPLYLKREDLEGYLDGIVSATYKEPGRIRSLLRLLHHER